MDTTLFSLFDDRSMTTQEIKDALVEAKKTACHPVVKRILALLQAEGGVELSTWLRVAIEVVEEQGGESKDWERCLNGLYIAADFAQSAESNHPISFE